MRTFEQGWAAKPFKEQFPQLSEAQAKKLDDLNSAITLLSIHGLLTDSQIKIVRGNKMPKAVEAELLRVPCIDCKMPITNCCCG